MKRKKRVAQQQQQQQQQRRKNQKSRKMKKVVKKNDDNQKNNTKKKKGRKRKRRKKNEARAERRRKKFKGRKQSLEEGEIVQNNNIEGEDDTSFISIIDDIPEENEVVVSSSSWDNKSLTPWISSIDHSLSPILRLHNDIMQFTKFISPTTRERSDRDSIERRIREVTSRLFTNSKLCVFGSTITNLCLPGSDVDMVVFFAPEDKTNRMTAFDLLSETLRQLGGIKNMEVIKHARVRNVRARSARTLIISLKHNEYHCITHTHIATHPPDNYEYRLYHSLMSSNITKYARTQVPIIKFQDISTQLNVDICFDQHSGLRTAKYVNKSLIDYPCARPLILVLKYFLSQRGLNETYQGGFGSFLVTLLVIGYLQYRVRKYGKELTRDMDLGTHLMGLLQLYGKEINACAVTMVLRNHGSFQRKMKHFLDMRRLTLFSVENPDEITSDVGKNSWDIAKVRQSLAHAFHVLRGVLMDNSGLDNIGLGAVIVPDEVLISRGG